MAEQVCTDAVASALVAGGGNVRHASGDSLLFTVQNGSVISGQARIDDYWLTIDACLPKAGHIAAKGKQLWSRLVRNGRLNGPVRFAVGPSGQEKLRADVPVDVGDGLEHEVADVCRELKEAYGAQSERSHGDSDASASVAPRAAAPSAEDICARFGGSGWDLTVKDEHVVAALDVPGRFVQARIQSCDADVTRASVSLLTVPGELPPVCQHAIGLFLLAMSNAGRLVRPTAYEDGGQTRVGCEVRFRAHANPSHGLSRALSSLSVATDLCFQEVRALTHESVSAAYLAVRTADGSRSGKSKQEGR